MAGVNKPALPLGPPPGTFQGDQHRALQREFEKLALAVRQLREGRISNLLALPSAPTAGLWAQGDVVRNSLPKITITSSTTYMLWGWEYTDEGLGTMTWAELRFWQAMSTGGGFTGASMTATHTGTGEGIYVGNAAGELTFRKLQEGSGISLTLSAGAIRITAIAAGFAASSMTATHTGSGVGLYVGNAAGELTFRKVQAGTGISITTSGGAVRITGTGGSFTHASISATHTGTGEGVYVGNDGTQLIFRKIQEGSGISLTTSGGALRIAATASGGPTTQTWTAANAGTESDAGFVTSTVTTAELAQRVAQLITALRSAGILTQPDMLWNTLDKGSSVTLSASDRVALNSAAAWSRVRSTRRKGPGSGKFYYEVRLSALPSSNYIHLGLATAQAADSYLGVDVYGYALAGNATKWHNGASAGYGATFWVATDVIGVLLDYSGALGILNFTLNGTTISTVPAYSSISSTMFASVALYNGAEVHGRFVSTSWSYAPVGYSQW